MNACYKKTHRKNHLVQKMANRARPRIRSKRQAPVDPEDALKAAKQQRERIENWAKLRRKYVDPLITKINTREIIANKLIENLRKIARKGHTFVSLTEVISDVCAKLCCEEGMVKTGIQMILESLEGSLLEQLPMWQMGLGEIDPEALKAGKLAYRHDYQIAKRVVDFIKKRPKEPPKTTGKKWFTPDGKKELNEDQTKCVERALWDPFLMIRGIAGAGKTTVLASMVDALKKQGDRVLLLAPTHRAAKKASESAKFKAQTIHEAIAYRPLGNSGIDKLKGKTQKSSDFVPTEGILPYDVMIVDEAAMVDSETMAHLLQRIDPKHTRIILIGDPNQLPPVGAGFPFRDMLSDQVINGQSQSIREIVNPIQLLKPMRTRSDDPLTHMLLDILRGQMPDFEQLEATGRVRFVRRPKNNWQEEVATLVEKGMNAPPFESDAEWKGLDPEQVQIFINSNNMVDQVNQIVQAKRYGTDFSEPMPIGSRVTTTRKMKDKGLAKGEMGIVISTNPRIVDFDGEKVPFEIPFDHRDKPLRLAGATTIHSGQGNEFEGVVYVMTKYFDEEEKEWRNAANNNLIYTALSRAKGDQSRIVIYYVNQNDFKEALEDRSASERNTLLPHYLAKGLEETP